MSGPLYLYDKASNRVMKLERWGEPKQLWIFYKHPDGQWVSLRLASEGDIKRLNNAGANIKLEE